MPERFLSLSDWQRASQTLTKLSRHDVSSCALTGGFASEMHCLKHGRPSSLRPLNDLDFIVDSFAAIPDTLAVDFLFRHIHPFDPPGKTLLQLVDPQTALRVDVFRAFGNTLQRTTTIALAGYTIRLISLADLVARSARLCLDLVLGLPTPSKYARDFLRLVELVNTADVEPAWQEQRKATQPTTFGEAKALLTAVISTRPDLLIVHHYSQDPEQVCLRCAAIPAFPLADPRLTYSLLGYY